MNDNKRNRFGLTERDIQTFQKIFNKYSDVKEVHIFGSRAKGNFKNGSDIDLAIVNQDFNSGTLAKLSGEFEESSLPYKVDLVVLNDLKLAELIDHINRVGVIFFKKEIHD
jgi:predicted nucleotidyltransferase